MRIRFLLFLLGFFLFFLSFATITEAAGLASSSATLTTSRASPSTPLAADQAANATQVTIYDNGSFFLSSDSAKIYPDTGETINANINVASMSASGIPTSGQRVVYFTGVVSNSHHNGDVIAFPITAMHTIQFTTVTAIPGSGKIVLTYPGSGNNTASPSATTFAFNNLASTNIQTNGVTCSSFTISSPTITCNVNGSGVGAATTVTILIGCSAASGVVCTTQVPTFINPAKSATAGTADIWKVSIQTQDNSSINLDYSKIAIGTIESPQILAQVDPTLTFTITGVNNGVNINSLVTSGCASQTTNSGTNATSTVVDMGVINQNVINLSGQYITVSTNAQNGYSVTATASGQLQNPANGYAIASSTTPSTMAAGTEYFGVQPCGTDAPSQYVPGSAIGSGGKVSWPTQTVLIPIAFRNTIADAIRTGLIYAGTTSGSTPEGQYSSIVTYVATPSF